MSFELAVQSCSYLGGKMTLNVKAVHKYVGEIDPRSDENSTQWTSLENKTTSIYLPWSLAEPNGESTNENCVTANAYGKNYRDVKCKEQHCFSCTFQDQAVFKLKGLPTPQLNQIDVDYVLLREPLYKGQFTFQGVSGRCQFHLNNILQTVLTCKYHKNAKIIIKPSVLLFSFWDLCV